MQHQSLAGHSREQRKQRTHTRIKNTMLLLMSEKPVSSINITELSQVSGVNRKTFYSHFESIDALIAELEDDFVYNMFSLLGQDKMPTYINTPPLLFRVLLERFEQNSDPLRLLILTGEHNRLLIKVKTRIIQTLGAMVLELDSSADQERFMYHIEFIAGGLMAVLEKWAMEPECIPFSTVSQAAWQLLEHVDTLF